MQSIDLSKWFYLGFLAVVIGVIMILRAKTNKSKLMENGYMLLILGLVGIVSEFTDFATVLLALAVISGIILLLDKLIWSKGRGHDAAKPHYIHYSKEFFPVVLGVWILRSFLFEAYQIPSSSMRPDLTVGDFILVNKFEYGIRMPITNKVIIPIRNVERGDVVVFQDQTKPNRDLIKRVIGLPGDTVAYIDKKLTINGVHVNYQSNGSYGYDEMSPNGSVMISTQRSIEDLMGDKHSVIVDNNFPPVIKEMVTDFPGKENCNYNDEGFTCKVPVGHYFMMGDNRDNSYDSRYWGFVPDDAILGHAIYVWLNLKDMSRIGTKID